MTCNKPVTISKFLMLALCTLVLVITSGFQPGNQRLKRVLMFAVGNPKAAPRIQEEYEYDLQGRISKVTVPLYTEQGREGVMSFDFYEYDSSGRLASVITNTANRESPTGFIPLKRTVNTWSEDGLKMKEAVEYPQAGLTEFSLYLYDKGRLAKIEKYGYGETLESFVVNEYNNSGDVLKETTFFKDGTQISETLHTYSNGLNVRSDVYIFNDRGREHLRTITKTYDTDNNLVTLESQELLIYSSMSSYVMKYEYD
jgi:hypothetical protein